MNYGYARVSTKEQNEERQIQALREQGIEIRRIYIDKCSGKDFSHLVYGPSAIKLLFSTPTVYNKSRFCGWKSILRQSRRVIADAMMIRKIGMVNTAFEEGTLLNGGSWKGAVADEEKNPGRDG